MTNLTMGILTLAMRNMLSAMVDSELETARVFWRQRYFQATDAEAHDPRPFLEVINERRANVDRGYVLPAEPASPTNTGE